MKSFSACLFLFLQLVNLSGYLAYECFIQRAESSFQQNLDKNSLASSASDTNLLEIKIPLHLPYSTEGKFERVKGQIERNGIWYSYVARKVSRDTLILECLPNQEKTRLELGIKEHAISDESVFASKSKTPLSKNMIRVDEFPCISNNYSFLGCEDIKSSVQIHLNIALSNGHFMKKKAPPRTLFQSLELNSKFLNSIPTV